MHLNTPQISEFYALEKFSSFLRCRALNPDLSRSLRNDRYVGCSYKKLQKEFLEFKKILS